MDSTGGSEGISSVVPSGAVGTVVESEVGSVVVPSPDHPAKPSAAKMKTIRKNPVELVRFNMTDLKRAN